MVNSRAVLKSEKQRAKMPKEEMQQNSKEDRLFQQKAGKVGGGEQGTEETNRKYSKIINLNPKTDNLQRKTV